MRNQIREEIRGIEPLDSLEREHIADAIAWIDSGAELCRLTKPAIPPKHLVSYFVVVDSGCVLLVDHQNARRWLPTGGHVEPNEHPRATVTREIVEELGFGTVHPVGPPLMLTVRKIIDLAHGCTTDPDSSTTVENTSGHTDVSLWYVVHGSRQQPISFAKDEFYAVQWFEFSNVPFHNSDPHLKRFITKLGLANLSARSVPPSGLG